MSSEQIKKLENAKTRLKAEAWEIWTAKVKKHVPLTSRDIDILIMAKGVT